MKNILIINGHPDSKSFNQALSDTYYESLNQEKVTSSIIQLRDLNFDPILRYGYRQRTELEPDLLIAIDKIKAADHIVWVYPMWWYGMPALLKGFVDRTFLPGVAFDYQENNTIPNKLFKGKTAHLIITSDSPRWYDFLIMKSPALNQMKKGVLAFCGIKTVKTSYIAPIKKSSGEFRKKWLEKVAKIASQQS
ncbi:MAG: NAD(P)H-dependent oxidoreductase [Reichenbachiella sp.]